MKQNLYSVVNTLFLHLLSAAIWDKPIDENLFKGIDANTWEGIAKMAKQQAVSALIADKALSLPDACLPPKAIKLQFIAIVQQTEARNLKMIAVLSELKNEYEEASFPFCLLKGLSVGANYPKPLLRNAGDIDLLLYQEGDFEKATELYSKKGYTIEKGSRTHNKFYKDSICIENHNRIIYFFNNKYDIIFNKQMNQLINTNSFTTIDINGVVVEQLPIEMNAFYIFYHMFFHFFHDGGVGFRQFNDWLLFLAKYKENIDDNSFINLANTYAMLYPMQVFAHAAIKYLDAPRDIFPFPIIEDHKNADLIIKDIFDGGNFGFHRPGIKQPKGAFYGMLHSYRTALKRSIRFGSISKEHIRNVPVQKIVNRFKMVFLNSSIRGC